MMMYTTNKITTLGNRKGNIKLLNTVIIEPSPGCLPPQTYTFSKMVPDLTAITLDHPGVVKV